MKLPRIKKVDIFILLPTLLLGLFLRIYKLPQMVGFDFDQEYAAMFAHTILKVYPIAMIGQGLSVQGLFMGPFYFYFLVPFFAISRLHPIGGYLGSITLSLGGIVVIYFLLRHVFGRTAGAIGAFLSATLLLYVQYSWVMAPTYSSVFFIFITWFCLYKYWHGNMSYLPVLGFVFGMYTSFHPIHFPFYLLFLVIFLVKRKIPSLKIMLLSITLFILPVTPLIMFEYFRHFLELKTLFSLQGSSAMEPKTFAKFFEYAMILFRFPVSLFNLPLTGWGATIFSSLFYLTPIALAAKKIGFWKDRFHVIVLSATPIIFLTYYFILPTHVPEYYFIGAESIIFLYAVASLALLAKTRGKFIIPVLLIVIFFFNMSGLVSLWRIPGNVTLAAKEYILLAIKEKQKDKPNFNILYNIDYGQQYGLGYLTRLYGIDPRGDVDTTYEIVLPLSRTKETLDIVAPSGGIGLIIRNNTKSK
jgi:hypothetical protein